MEDTTAEMINNSEFLNRIEAAAYESVRNSYPGVVRVRDQSPEDMDRCVQACQRAGLSARRAPTGGSSRAPQQHHQ